MHDLRSFLETVRQQRPAEFVEVQREVQPRYETAAILAKFEQQLRSPVLFFQKVAGCNFPLVTNVCGSRGRLALALDCSPNELPEKYDHACRNPLKPSLQTQGAVQENVFQGANADLRILPQMVYHLNDSDRPYITAAIILARDPKTDRTNLSYHRLMIAGPRRTGIFMEHGHLHAIYGAYRQAGQAMPIAAIIGVHPLWSLGTLYTGSPEVEEYDIIGGLQGTPLEVIRCVTQPELCVPCRAEFVLEGVVSPDQHIEEGPFGEFTGVSTGRCATPVFEVNAITFRHGAIFQDIVSGQMEHLTLPALGLERHVADAARQAVPAVARVVMPVPLTVFASLHKTNDDEPVKLIEALLRSNLHVKHVVVTDASVNVSDMRQVLTAISLHVQADRDIHVFKDEQGTPCDPSSDSADGKTTKMGIDATVRLSSEKRVAKNSLPQELLNSIRLADFPDNAARGSS